MGTRSADGVARDGTRFRGGVEVGMEEVRAQLEGANMCAKR